MVTVSHQVKTDVFIVGGGPAGLSAAIAAAQKGLRVAIADRGYPPLDKACGEGLMPDAVSALNRLGIMISSREEAHPLRGIRFVDGEKSAEAAFPRTPGMGVRRTTLHRYLTRRAGELGVTIFWGAQVELCNPGQPCLNGFPICSHWIVGADGSQSRVRQWAGFQQQYCRKRFGFRRHYRVVPWTDCVEIYWRHGCQVFVTPVGPQEVGVALLCSTPRLRLEWALRLFPEITMRLQGAPTVTNEKGGLCAELQLDRVTNGAFALVGDASGSVDPITGQGLCLAFQQAEWLAEAFASTNMGLYEAAHKEIFRLPSIMSRLLLFMGRHDSLRHALLHVFEAQPGIFSGFVAAHVGLLPIPFICPRDNDSVISGRRLAEN